VFFFVVEIDNLNGSCLAMNIDIERLLYVSQKNDTMRLGLYSGPLLKDAFSL